LSHFLGQKVPSSPQKKGCSTMKKHIILSLVCGLCTLLLPITQALAAVPATTPAKQTLTKAATTTAAKETATKTTSDTTQRQTTVGQAAATDLAKQDTSITKSPAVVLPAITQWTVAGTNSRYIVSFDEKNLKYDKKTGIITTWTKWEAKSASSKSAKYTYLLSQYDIRLKTYANLKQINTLATGETLSAGAAGDTSWHTVNLGTLGEDICTALNNYFLSH